MFSSAFAPGGSIAGTQVFFSTFGQAVIGPILRQSPYQDSLTPPDQEPPGGNTPEPEPPVDPEEEEPEEEDP